MLALLLAAATPASSPVRVERSRDTAPGASVSTSLDTNGEGEAQVAATQTALDAERAFAADAKRLGQWTAFRKWAAPDATMFVPQPINAQTWLKDRKDPPKSVERWPTASYVSCDGSLAVNTGGWKRADGSVGYFTTVWQRQPDGRYTWIVDHGDVLATPRAAIPSPEVSRAACTPPKFLPLWQTHDGGKARERLGSVDHTLYWRWEVDAGGRRWLDVSLWTGERLDIVVQDAVTK